MNEGEGSLGNKGEGTKIDVVKKTEGLYKDERPMCTGWLSNTVAGDTIEIQYGCKHQRQGCIISLSSEKEYGRNMPLFFLQGKKGNHGDTNPHPQ